MISSSAASLRMFLRLCKFVALIFFAVESGAPALAVDMRDTFAIAIGAASVAEEHCGMQGEVARAQAFVDSFNSGVLRSNNPADIRLLIYRAASANALVRQNGAQSWCTEYRAQRALIGGY